MPHENVEEYLETIFDIAVADGAVKTSAIANRLYLTPASATEALHYLAGGAETMLDAFPYG